MSTKQLQLLFAVLLGVLMLGMVACKKDSLVETAIPQPPVEQEEEEEETPNPPPPPIDTCQRYTVAINVDSLLNSGWIFDFHDACECDTVDIVPTNFPFGTHHIGWSDWFGSTIHSNAMSTGHTQDTLVALIAHDSLFMPPLESVLFLELAFDPCD